MDSLRLFSTFTSTKRSFHKLPSKPKKLLPRDQNGMVTRAKDEKPYVSRQEILDKINKKKAGEGQIATKPRGQKFGMDFMEGSEDSAGDVQKNNPNDPMTSEKLKSILSSGAINFNSKEQEVLKKILG